ncbi:MotA/TolQ/ExbB proton channel family protein [Neptunicella sp. SCSIO 80796]|uniref:MotA/TolQ/ExbB proton channel family protein n=1 Tax=Neptunicella plasticusilytica TaxID=3117012 RepID=UPI003A4D8166
MIDELLTNWVCWAIALLALACYQQLLLSFLQLKTGGNQTDVYHHHHMDFLLIMIGALPLLGLLGTIIGLLACFAGIATQGASGALLSGGISDALLTTQMGLVCAVPAWLLHHWLHSSQQKHYQQQHYQQQLQLRKG